MSSQITINAGTVITVQNVEETTEIVSPLDTDLIAMGRGVETVHTTVEDFKAPLIALVTQSVIGSATPSSSPTGTETNGQSYRVSNTKVVPDPDDGSNDDIYTHFLTNTPDGSGGFLPIIVPASTSGLITKSGDSWVFIKDQVNPNRLIKITERAETTFRLNDVPIFDTGNQYLSLVDKAINGVTTINSNYRYVAISSFYAQRKSDGTFILNSTLTLSNSLTEGDPNDMDILCYLPITASRTVPASGVMRMYFKDNSATPKLQQAEVILDMSYFSLDTTYSFSFATKKVGLINTGFVDGINTKKGFPIGRDGYNVFNGTPFGLHRGFLELGNWGNVSDKEFRFVRMDRGSDGTVTLDIAVDVDGTQLAMLRSTIAASDFVGVYSGAMTWPGSGTPNRDYGIEVKIDCDAITEHFPAGAFTTSPFDGYTLDMAPLDYYTKQLVADRYSFTQGGYADYRAMWYLNGDYRLTPYGIKLPEGATNFSYNGFLDKNANILFGDKGGKIIAFGWENEDGTKYSGAENKTELSGEIPEGAHYVHLSTKTANIATTSFYVTGKFKNEEKRDFFSVQSAILDNTVPDGVYTAQKFTFRKKGKDINDVEILDGNDLALADDYSYNGVKVTGPSFGHLVNYKNGLRYFYNGNVNKIYTLDDNDNRVDLFTDVTHPTVWGASAKVGNGRAVLEVLKDKSVLFSLAFNDGDNRYYSLYKLKPDGTLTKCFNYSNDFYHKDWLPTSDPDYNKPGFANGCPVGDWSFTYAEGLILATEYGEGTSAYWAENNPSLGGNGRGVSACVWASNNQGDSWVKVLDLNDKKVPANGEADDNWKYATTTNYRKLQHIHVIRYDNYARRILVTNGDGQNYLWSIGIDDLKAFISTALPVDPNDFPVADTPSPVWTSYMICISNDLAPIMNYNSMRLQFTGLHPMEQGILLLHDAPREFNYFLHRNGYIDGVGNIEPTYNWENINDFDTTVEFTTSQVTTDGFVMNSIRFSKSEPILISHSASGKYCRIWGTYNGFQHRELLKTDQKIIKFGCRVFQHESGDLFISSGVDETPSTAGYVVVEKNRLN